MNIERQQTCIFIYYDNVDGISSSEIDNRLNKYKDDYKINIEDINVIQQFIPVRNKNSSVETIWI